MISVDQGRCVQGRTGETIAAAKLNPNRSNDPGKKKVQRRGGSGKDRRHHDSFMLRAGIADATSRHNKSRSTHHKSPIHECILIRAETPFFLVIYTTKAAKPQTLPITIMASPAARDPPPPPSPPSAEVALAVVFAAARGLNMGTPTMRSGIQPSIAAANSTMSARK